MYICVYVFIYVHTYYLGTFIPYEEGKICVVDTSTGFVHTNSSVKSGTFELLDGRNCTEYKLSTSNYGSSGAVLISVPFSMFQHTYNKIFVSITQYLAMQLCMYIQIIINLSLSKVVLNSRDAQGNVWLS